MGASGSLLMATMTFDPFMPARCWMAPEIPTAMYSSGATTLPVCPTCQSLGTHPASTAARLAPSAAFKSSASPSSSLKSPLVPRPPATTTRASVSSGRALFTSLNSTKRVRSDPRSTFTVAAAVLPAPCFCATGNSVARTVKHFTGVASSTSASTLPAHMGRWKVTCAPEPPKPSTSVAQAAPRRAATRGTRSLPKARSEEHTSELQSPPDLVCRLLLEKKNHNNLQPLTTQRPNNERYYTKADC